MVALYNNTGGPNWFNHNNWLTTAPVSQWYGIGLGLSARKHRVTIVSLASNNLIGSIPSTIGDIDSAFYITLNNNQLSGSIPSSLGNLKALINLILYDNNLSGSIPAEFGNLSSISRLLINNNLLTGSIPAAIGNLKSNVSIDASHNKLTGAIPSEMGSMSGLESLNLGYNQLSGSIPSELGNLSMLGTLDLQHNLLSGAIPDALGNPPFLRVLLLNNNKLSGSIPPHLRAVMLHLNNNKLSGEIPSELSKYDFDDLRLNNNQLSGRVIEFSWHLRTKGTLHLENNNFTFAGMLYLVRNFANLKKLFYAPQAPISIQKNADSLSVDAGGMYQLKFDTFKWYKGSMLVVTIKNDSTYHPTEIGNYSVVVTNSVATALTLYSDTIHYDVANNAIASQIKANSTAASVYPNPAKSIATLLFNADGKYTVTVADISGKILQTKKGISNKSINTIQLDVSKFASSNYLVTIVDEKNKKQTLQLNKE